MTLPFTNPMMHDAKATTRLVVNGLVIGVESGLLETVLEVSNDKVQVDR